MPLAETTRQPIPVKPEELVKAALEKVGRSQIYATIACANHGKTIWNQQTKLTQALLREVGDHYITLPQSVRKALEEFIRG